MQTTTLLLLLSLLLSAATATATTTTTFLRSACQSTLYPNLCLHYISSYPTSSSRSHRRLAFTALSVTLLHANSAFNYIHRLSTHSTTTTLASGGSLNDCVQSMDDVVMRLRLSLKQLRHMGRADNPNFAYRLSNVQTWASAALTDVNACLESFGEAEGGKVRRRVEVVGKLVTNALALVNLIEV